MSALYSIQFLSAFEENVSYLSVEFFFFFFFFFIFFSACHWSPSISKSNMTPVAFAKTTSSYEVTLVTSIGKPRMTRYPPSRLRNHTRFATWFTICVVITSSDQTVWAMHSTNRTRLCGPCIAPIAVKTFFRSTASSHSS